MIPMKNPFKAPLDEERIERLCRECHGDGTVRCDECDGDGTHECDCGHAHDCGECHGAGEWTCEHCFGSGCEITGPRTALELLMPTVAPEVQRVLVRVSPRLDAGGLPRWMPELREDRLHLVCVVECLASDLATQTELAAVGFLPWYVDRYFDGRVAYRRFKLDTGLVACAERCRAEAVTP